jgi:MATE family multidrug resistance protein
VTFVFLTGYAFYGGDLRRYGLFRWGRPNTRLGGVVVNVSWPVALESLVDTGRWLLFFVIVEHLGEAPLAGANVVYSIYALLLLPIEGFSDTTTTLVSQLIGGGATGGIGGVVRRAVTSATLFATPFVLLALLAPDLPISFFTSEPAIVDSAGGSLRVIALALLIVIPAEMVFAAVAGTGDTRSTLLIEVALSSTVLAWVAATALGLGLSMPVVWGGEIAGWVVCFLLSLLWLKGERWKRLDL